MNKIYIYLTIIFLLISTNLFTLTVSITTTTYILDRIWAQYTNKIEYKVFNAFHRKCMNVLGENGTCNQTAKELYRIYEKDWAPLPGFDWPKITELESANEN